METPEFILLFNKLILKFQINEHFFSSLFILESSGVGYLLLKNLFSY